MLPKRIDPGRQQEGLWPGRQPSNQRRPAFSNWIEIRNFHSLPFPSPLSALARPQSMTVSMSSMVMAVSAMFVLNTIFLTWASCRDSETFKKHIRRDRATMQYLWHFRMLQDVSVLWGLASWHSVKILPRILGRVISAAINYTILHPHTDIDIC